MKYLRTCYNYDHVFIMLLLCILHIAQSQEISKDFTSHPNWHLVDREDDCGQSVADRIIGGYKATLGQYPWIARLGYSKRWKRNRSSPEYDCGGAIINSRYILTAAHCSPEVIHKDLVSVRVGEHDEMKNPDCVDGICAPPVQDIEVAEHHCHPQYTYKNFTNDICLLRLVSPISFNEYVQPICLPSYDLFENQTFVTEIMEVAGWGVTDVDTGEASTVLMSLKVPIVSNDLCKEEYSGKATIINTQMCAGGVLGKDSCSGDSGGPLMKALSIQAPPRYFIVGVVSFGPNSCAKTHVAGVYTKVSNYMKWILDTVKE